MNNFPTLHITYTTWLLSVWRYFFSLLFWIKKITWLISTPQIWITFFWIKLTPLEPDYLLSGLISTNWIPDVRYSDPYCTSTWVLNPRRCPKIFQGHAQKVLKTLFTYFLAILQSSPKWKLVQAKTYLPKALKFAKLAKNPLIW